MAVHEDGTVGMSVPAKEALRMPRTHWRRLLGLQEMGVYYALLLLVAVLSLVTTAQHQDN